jgi:hypothetical protein
MGEPSFVPGKLNHLSDAAKDEDKKMARAAPQDVRNQGLFPSEAEIARRLSQSPADWAAKSTILERAGLPHIDPVMGGRCWLAVLAWLKRRYGISTTEVSQPDGEENLDELR